MLEYGLAEIPATITQGNPYRWFIRPSQHDSASRYLHLEKFVPSRFGGKGKWESVYKEYISQYLTDAHGFDAATREAANDIIKAMTVNFYLPTGEVR